MSGSLGIPLMAAYLREEYVCRNIRSSDLINQAWLQSKIPNIDQGDVRRKASNY